MSGAIAALRRDLGDNLFVRAGGGIVLTPGGQRLASIAAEILGLGDRARRAVREARGEAALLRVAATSDVSEHAAAALLNAFTRRAPNVEVSVAVEPGDAFADLLGQRRADVALGPRSAGDRALGLESVPFLRCRQVVVAGRRHRLAGAGELAPSALAGERWLVGPAGVAPTTPTGRFLARARLDPSEVLAFPSDAAAVSAAADGEGVMLAIAHAVLPALRGGRIVHLHVRGTPVDDLWHASTLAPDRRTDAAWALRRFVTTPEATQAMLSGGEGVPAGRFRPTTYVTLWSEPG